MKTFIERMYRPTAAMLASMLLGLSLAPGVAAACEGGGEEEGGKGESPNLSISASPKLVTIPSPKSTITITNINLTENATIKKVGAKVEENGSQWSFKETTCNEIKLPPLEKCVIPVTYIGQLNSKVTFVALDEHELPSGTATITATPPIRTEPNELAFKEIVVGSEGKLSLKAKANEKVQIKLVNPSGTAFKVASDSCKGKTLETGNECAVEVHFAPKEKIPYANTLDIPYEILSPKISLTREIPLTGKGI